MLGWWSGGKGDKWHLVCSKHTVSILRERREFLQSAELGLELFYLGILQEKKKQKIGKSGEA